jgi:hypothetical protein
MQDCPSDEILSWQFLAQPADVLLADTVSSSTDKELLFSGIIAISRSRFFASLCNAHGTQN